MGNGGGMRAAESDALGGGVRCDGEGGGDAMADAMLD